MQKPLVLVLAGSLLLFSGRLNGQSQDDDGTKGTKIVFHVTSVTHKDDDTVCQSGKCSATKFTVEGYSDVQRAGTRVAYVLTCDEYVVFEPTPHITMACGRVHANSDYIAKLYADSIYFVDDRQKPAGAPQEVSYDIQSEKEVSKQGKVVR